VAVATTGPASKSGGGRHPGGGVGQFGGGL